MTEQELRALVRDAIARHTGAAAPAARGARVQPDLSRHASHAMFVIADGGDEGGPCVIEPAVACTHCGYCKSYGH
jgi:hypothetical protein